MRYFKSIIFTVFYISLISFGYSQREIPNPPENGIAVFDETSTLNRNEINSLSEILINYNDSTSTQIVVAILKNVNGEHLGTFAAKWAHEWGIGGKEKDNGILLMVAMEEREVFISTGYGVEDKLTDALTKRIITQTITPRFREGQFYSGIRNGVFDIFSVLNGSFKSNQRNENSAGGIKKIFFIIFVIIMIIVFISRKGKRGGGYYNSRDRSILFGSGGFGSGSFGGGSGTSFGGGFGGGGFGGGGAGGSW